MSVKKKKKTKAELKRQQELIKFISCIVASALSLIAGFRFGIIGAFLDNCMRIIIGQYTWPYYIVIVGVSLTLLLKPKLLEKSYKFWTGISLLFLSAILIQALLFQGKSEGFVGVQDFFTQIPEIFKDPTRSAYGGIVGAIIYGGLSYLLDVGGVIILVFVFILVGLSLLITPARMLDTASKGTEKTKGFFDKVGDWRDAKKAKKEAKNLKSVDDMIEDNFEVNPTKASFIEFDDTIEPVETSVLDATPKGNPSIFINHEDVEPGKQITFEKELEPVILPTEHQEGLREDVRKETDSRPSSFENYRLPPLTLLDPVKGNQRSSANAGSAKDKADRLIKVLKQFGIEASLLDIHIGPAVTKFELKPDSSVKISKISSIQDNLMMELAVKTLRIEAPIPGKSAVGIEIPNIEMVPVKMREVIQKSPSFHDTENIQVALGKNLLGQPITVSLNKMPHLLVAGATGSGKSVCMNAIITSILLTKSPDELKMLLVDPKKVEFTPYENIPHLIGPVISDPMQASMALKVVVEEMESRYDAFSKAGVRNIASFNEKVKQNPQDNIQKLPWIVVIIDELADLMAVAGKEVETSIQRITQLARAAGIHLIVATQRPSVDVVTGVIKANIPSRIAFAVSSAVDSRTILDASGADKLLGYGDMLYIPMGEPNPVRVQGVYVSDDEVRRITERASSQAKPHYNDAFIRLNGVEGNNGIISGSEEPLYEEAVAFVVKERRASTSLLQRQFRIGYNRAANLVDSLEQNGVIGPANGSKPRDVYKQDHDEEIED